MNRKEFITLSALGSTSLLIPQFLKSASASGILSSSSAAGRKLIVVQLSGGNDGLNTIIPYRNDLYYQLRPTLGLKGSDILHLNDELGINCAMDGLYALYQQGLVTVVNNVGYPNPDRSHFRSMDIWHSASDSSDYLSTGWLGRYLDSDCPSCSHPYAGIEIDDTLSLAMKGSKRKGLAIHDTQLYYTLAKNLHENNAANNNNGNLGYLYKTLAETEQSAAYLYNQSKIYKSPINYPNDGFAKNLKTIAELIASGCDTSVYYASLGGFDTHVNQLGVQEKNLSRVSLALEALVSDLRQSHRLDDTLIVVFSEFGRRVKQNASNGTDHGKANNVFIISSKLTKSGIYNSSPDLAQLDDGDVAYTIDFRSIYATILKRWLGADDKAILGKEFQQLNFV